MGEEKRKKGHSVGLGKVVGIAVVCIFVGMILGGFLAFAVVGPELQKLHIDFGYLANNSQDNNNGNGNNNNNNNNNNNQNQGGGVTNNNQPPSNVTASYGGSGQFQISMTSDGTHYSGTLTANIGAPVQQIGNTIQFSLEIAPTSVTGNLAQVIPTDGSGGTTFNFVGTVSDSQVTANAQGSSGNGQNFDLNLSGTIDSNTFAFTITSGSNAQMVITTTQQISLHNNT